MGEVLLQPVRESRIRALVLRRQRIALPAWGPVVWALITEETTRGTVRRSRAYVGVLLNRVLTSAVVSVSVEVHNGRHAVIHAFARMPMRECGDLDPALSHLRDEAVGRAEVDCIAENSVAHEGITTVAATML